MTSNLSKKQTVKKNQKTDEYKGTRLNFTVHFETRAGRMRT